MNRELDVRTLLKALRKYYPIVIAAVLVCAALMAGYTLTRKPVYSASADFLSVNNPNQQYTSSTLVAAAKDLVNDYIEITVSDVMLDTVAASLNESGGASYTNASLRRMIKVSTKGAKSAIYSVTVNSNDPEQSEKVIKAVMDNMQPVIDGLVMRDDAVKCLTVTPQAEKVSSGLTRNVVIGIAAGLLISISIIAIIVIADTKLRSEADVKEAFADIPVIGIIPTWKSNLSSASNSSEKTDKKINGGNRNE